ncbi:hypothetical protein D9758_012611 [Tetrapyrgos nigripes]|uniref:DNA 3'-5' helicase n=1 Tax=Tetrapyrgos nigripes TaxID=182062 RepID=A0A8H5GDR0_9AGAR|nr:hypothetical protein D9758_012611 [Tetrapyrgos nigripes]
MAPDPRVMAHERETERSYKNLSTARLDAARTRPGGYNSQAYRTLLHEEFKKRLPGMEPYEWQLDVSEALFLGLDCTVIAGTGSGKTMPFVMPLFAAKDKVFGGKDKVMVIIISPLNALEEDQAKKFNAMGISAVAVNKDTYTKEVHQAIQNNEYNDILTSPELALEHDKFHEWGNKFRPIYQDLGTLRLFVGLDIPFLATSATLTPPALAQVRKTLNINSLDSFHLNSGIDRYNIAWFVRRMNAGKSNLDVLSFVLKENPGDLEVTELLLTMVFFDDINVALAALKHLQECLPRHLRGQIAVYNLRHSTWSKRRILQEFREGKIKIFLTTEAAGMGWDIPNIYHVMQFMVPKAQAFLLVQPTVFQEMKSKEKGDDDKAVYKKDVEAADTFDDHRPRTAPTGICCDNCLRKQDPNHPLLYIEPALSKSASKQPTNSEEPLSEPNSNGKRPMVTVPATRKDVHLSSVRSLLEKWRYATFLEKYSSCSWGADALLPPKVLTTIATKAWLSSIDDLIGAGWSPIFARKHGLDILERIAMVDEEHYDAVQKGKQAERKEKDDQKAAEKKEKEEQKAAEKKEKEELKAAKKKEKEEREAAEKEAKQRVKDQKAAEKREKEAQDLAAKRERLAKKENANALKLKLALEKPKRGRGQPRKEQLPTPPSPSTPMIPPLPMQPASSSPRPRPKPRPRPRPLPRKEQTLTPLTPSTSMIPPLPLSPQQNQVNQMPVQTTPYTFNMFMPVPFTSIPYHASHSIVPYGAMPPSKDSSNVHDNEFTFFTDNHST